MKNYNYILILSLFLFSFAANADQVPTAMHEIFFKSDLIVEAKIVNNTSHDYTILILDTYHNRQTGIKIGDYIKIKKEINVIKSSEAVHSQNILDRLTGVAFLSKSVSGWGVRKFSFFYDKRATILVNSRGCRVQGTSSELKAEIQNYFKEFKTDNNGNVIGKKTVKEVEKLPLSQMVLIQYTQIYRFTIDRSIYEKMNCNSIQEDVIYKPSE